MLDRSHRLTERDDFARAVRKGRRAGTSTMVLHLLTPAADTPGPDQPATGRPRPARVGFVVGKAVGPAVSRNRVKRRLRHLVRDRLPLLPHGSRLVVRALPAAATATSEELARDLDRALARARRTSVTAGGPW